MIDKFKLETLLYLLLRDHLTFGELERIMRDVDLISIKNIPTYQEKIVSNYCKELVSRFEIPKNTAFCKKNNSEN